MARTYIFSRRRNDRFVYGVSNVPVAKLQKEGVTGSDKVAKHGRVEEEEEEEGKEEGVEMIGGILSGSDAS